MNPKTNIFRRQLLSITLVLALFGLGSCGSFLKKTTNVSDYPKHSEIVYNFFSEYSISTSSYPGINVNFHKTPKGIEVVMMAFEGEEYKEVERYLFWDVKSQKYQKLDLNHSLHNPNHESIYGNHTRFLSSVNSHINFDLNYYYNYSDWHNDVVNQFANYSGNDQKINYSLAQAYIQTIFKSHYYETKNRKITQKDWDNALKGINIMQRLSNDNFDVQTIIGDIHMKMSNDIMGVILENRYGAWGFDEKDLLNRVVYNDFLLRQCRTLLNSCPSNTILFTHGDNDTYPFYYLQWKEGFRTDVIIVNTSLLNTKDYRDFIRKQNIKTQIPEAYFEEDKFVYGGIDKTSEEFVGFEQIKEKVLGFEYNKTNLNMINNKIRYTKDSETLKLVISESIIYSSEMMQIDLICNNNNPIYFVSVPVWINTTESTSHAMPYLTALGNLDSDYKVRKSIEILENLVNNSVSDIKRNEFNTISMALYHQMYSTALNILNQNKENDAYLKYANNYLNFISSEEALNHHSIYILFDLWKNYALSDLVLERCETLRKVLMNNLKNHTSDPNIDEFVIYKISSDLYALVLAYQILDKPMDAELNQRLIAFFNQVYSKKPYLKQTVINQRFLHNYLEQF